MGTRGRKSAADLAIAPVTVSERPRPPSYLTPEQKSEWVTIVNEAPADRYPEGLLTLLESYCKHSVDLRHVGQLIENLKADEDFDVKDYDRLLKMQERESRCLASLAVRLGFAHTTRKHDQKKASLRKDYGY